MGTIIFEYSLCLIEESMVFIFMNSLLKSRFKSRLSLIAAIVLGSMLVYSYSNCDIIIKSLIDVIKDIMLSSILFKNNMIVKASYSFLCTYVFFIPEMMFGNIIAIILNQEFLSVFYSTFIQRLIICLFVKLFNAATFYVFYKLLRKINHDIRDKFWRIFGLTMLAFWLVSTSCLYIYTNFAGNLYFDIMYTTIAVSFFIMSIDVIYFFAKVNIGLQNDSKLFLLESNFNLLQEQIAFQKQNINEFHKLRHDMKNHIANVKALIEKGSIEEAMLLLDESGSAYESVTLMDLNS